MSDDQTDWKFKFTELLDTCQSELKKTTQIGKKMLSASQSTADLNEAYRSLGILFKDYIASGEVQVDSEKVNDLISIASKLEADLEGYESDVQTLKKS